MPALIILALWVALLAPGVIRWARRHRPTNSIASFHRQLRGLEHSGPKLMEPAFRLGGQDERARRRTEPPSEAPQLVLLRGGAPTKEPTTMRHQDRHQGAYDGYDDRYETYEDDASAPWDDPWGRAGDDATVGYAPAPRSRRTVRAPRAEEYDGYDDDPYLDDYHDVVDEPLHVLPPARARARRTRIVVGLSAAVFVSFVAGLLPGLTVLWAVALLALVALIAYLGLMFYAANAGMYGRDALAHVTPVASTVVTPYARGRGYEDDDEDGWSSRRVASAR